MNFDYAVSNKAIDNYTPQDPNIAYDKITCISNNASFVGRAPNCCIYLTIVGHVPPFACV